MTQLANSQRTFNMYSTCIVVLQKNIGQSLRAHMFCWLVHIQKYKPTNLILTPLESDHHFKYKMRKDNPKTHQNSPQSTLFQKFRGGGGYAPRRWRATLFPPLFQNPVWHPGLHVTGVCLSSCTDNCRLVVQLKCMLNCTVVTRVTTGCNSLVKFSSLQILNVAWNDSYP